MRCPVWAARALRNAAEPGGGALAPRAVGSRVTFQGGFASPVLFSLPLGPFAAPPEFGIGVAVFVGQILCGVPDGQSLRIVSEKSIRIGGTDRE